MQNTRTFQPPAKGSTYEPFQWAILMHVQAPEGCHPDMKDTTLSDKYSHLSYFFYHI